MWKRLKYSYTKPDVYSLCCCPGKQSVRAKLLPPPLFLGKHCSLMSTPCHWCCCWQQLWIAHTLLPLKSLLSIILPWWKLYKEDLIWVSPSEDLINSWGVLCWIWVKLKWVVKKKTLSLDTIGCQLLFHHKWKKKGKVKIWWKLIFSNSQLSFLLNPYPFLSPWSLQLLTGNFSADKRAELAVTGVPVLTQLTLLL